MNRVGQTGKVEKKKRGIIKKSIFVIKGSKLIKPFVHANSKALADLIISFFAGDLYIYIYI